MHASPFPESAAPGKLPSRAQSRALRMLGEPWRPSDVPIRIPFPEQTLDNRPDTREAGRLYIDELSIVVNRRPDTIRKWERAGMLPQHLMPKRGARDWRYWTDNQVYGQRGIINWMKKNDMRPGSYLTTPDQEPAHIKNMRRPRIKIELLREIRYWGRTHKSGVKKGQHRRSRKWIINHYFPRTSYTNKANFEKALSTYFSLQGWEFPPPAPAKPARRRKSDRMTTAQIKKHPEVRAATREANRIIRLVDRKMKKTTKGKK